MTISLQLLFEEIHQLKQMDSLRSHLAPQIGQYFAAERSGIFLFDQLEAEPRFRNVLKLALSVKHNPVAAYIAQRHTPVHEGLVTTPKTWQLICPRPDHWHVMAGPIINRTQIIGAVGCTRDKSMPAFETQDLADLGAICLHLSTWITAVRVSPNLQPERSRNLSKVSQLTARELQIAELVALGRTNAEIGRELWITENSVKQALKRMFRKLDVSSRAEMVAHIFATYHSS